MEPQGRFAARLAVISRPPDCDTATLRGAAQYGLAHRPLVSSVIAPQSYMMKVRKCVCLLVLSPFSPAIQLILSLRHLFLLLFPHFTLWIFSRFCSPRR